VSPWCAAFERIKFSARCAPVSVSALGALHDGGVRSNKYIEPRMKTPHILLATSNAPRMRKNLEAILDAKALAAIDQEITSNVAAMYSLGSYHYSFAMGLQASDWRQKVSRLYYAAYQVSRCLRFHVRGEFHQDVTDHKKIDELPVGFPKQATYTNKLGVLRDDRNICDYDHTAVESDLVHTVTDSAALVSDLLTDAKTYLNSRGVSV
jgi:hypothetical protein